jgi:hypothetical protein
MTAQEQAESRMMDILRQRIAGVDQYGNSLSQADHQAAIRQYEEMKQRIDARKDAEAKLDIERQRAAMEAERVRLDAEKQKAAIEAESRRIDLEAERVQIQKAEVVVKMLEVAQKGGVGGEQLLSLIAGVSDRLLPGPDATLPADCLLPQRETS